MSVMRDRIAEVVDDNYACTNGAEVDNVVYIADAIIAALPDMILDLEWRNDRPASHGYPDVAMLQDGHGYYQRWFVYGKEYFKHSTWKYGQEGDANAHHKASIMTALGVSA